jgi:hypothetical protein
MVMMMMMIIRRMMMMVMMMMMVVVSPRQTEERCPGSSEWHPGARTRLHKHRAQRHADILMTIIRMVHHHRLHHPRHLSRRIKDYHGQHHRHHWQYHHPSPLLA